MSAILPMKIDELVYFPLLITDALSVHGESFGVSPSFDIPPLAGDEVQDKSVQDKSVTNSEG
jgi:hypothetical protein